MNTRIRHPLSGLELYQLSFNYRVFDYKMRIHAWISVFLLSIWIPLGLTLHESWGWENNLIENSQLVIIALGAVASFRVARRFEPKTKLRYFWFWSIGIWALCFARELSWGRSLFPKGNIDGAPIFYSLDELWFGSWVHPIVGLTILLVAVGLLSNVDIKGLIRTVRIPVFCAFAFVLTALLSSMFEQECFSLTVARATVLEELGETIMWWSLLGVIAPNTGQS